MITKSVWLASVAFLPITFSSVHQKAEKPPTLTEARAGFRTTLIENAFEPDGPAEVPPEGVLELVRYTSPAGELVAYRSPDPGDGKRRPAVIWAHGGFGGIGAWLWEEDSYLAPFLAQGFAVFCPSWRGENDNPGEFELFYGEVDDALAAIDAVAQLPWVDPTRIYMAGHSTGGTLTLLTALSTTKLRAAFSFGGAPDIHYIVGDGEGYGNTPFDHENEREGFLRSATNFVATLTVPTFYFEGEQIGDYATQAQAMEEKAKAAKAPFQAHIVEKSDHFEHMPVYLALVAEAIAADSGARPNVRLTPKRLRQAQETFLEQRLATMRANQLDQDRAMLELLEMLEVDLTVETRFAFRVIRYYVRAPIDATAARLAKLGFVDPVIEETVDDEGDVLFTLKVHKTLLPTLEILHEHSVQVMEAADACGTHYMSFTKAR